MTLLKELIEIPQRVQRGDFVLKLSEGVDRAAETLRDYVVTPELRACFDDALGFIQSAIESRTSKATYLHGSFGSGKSHYMAVLHLVLQGNATARGIPELAPVILNHNAWMTGQRLLLVPYHMLGSHDMESSILGGYVDFIRRTHPDAPIPGVYLAEGLFRDAQGLRESMGDAAFFTRLNEGRSAGEGWGDLEAGWDAERFDQAVTAPPGAEQRSQLISALVKRFFGSYDTQAAARGEAFVSLDKGLSVLSQHAAGLGYDGLILFLDELVLWLAGYAADLNFVHREGQKLAKLVEAQTADRPVPVISFVARQRDLRELIGDAVPGAERLNFGDALRHWEGRFHRITLEDRNLPAIAEKRVLRCRSEAARQELDAAFRQTAQVRESVMNILLTSQGDREMFRQVYPFSPALVQTLIAVSSVLQRERTALKVMVQLLVEQRETLRVGDLVPVGDLFDCIAHGDEAFSQEMALWFDNAKRLYHQKLLPLLEQQAGLRREELERLPPGDARRVAFRNDDRLVKTLLLAALVPQVESLRALTAERLAALNHGTIRSPIPGREGQLVLAKCREWAARVGEVRIGEETTNPTVSVQLSGVDTESIVEQARREDNQGNRIRRVRQMLFEQLAVEGEGEFEQTHEFLWRNTRRTSVVLFKNVRDLPDPSLEHDGEGWKVIIDFPFDETGHGPRDDLGRLDQFRRSHVQGTKTLCWIPAFFSGDAQRDLGMLVILEHILAGERFVQYAHHLSPQDRQAAKSLLDNQRSVLRQRVQNHLDAAYGLPTSLAGSLDTTHDLEPSERFASLYPGLELQPPSAANLRQALEGLLGQALEYEYPAAPQFEEEVKSSGLRKVLELATQAAREDGRLAVDRPLRPLLRHVANPLQLGEMGHDATHFVLGQHWRQHFVRQAAEAGGAVTVDRLRRWIDEPRRMGLPKEAQNLVLLVYAEQTNSSFHLHGAPYEAKLGDLPDACELRQQRLPGEAAWQSAVERAGSLFGLGVSPLLNAGNVSQLVAGVSKLAAEHRAACLEYHQRLRERLARFGAEAAHTDRGKTAAATVALADRLTAGTADVVGLLTTAPLATSAAAMGQCLKKANELSHCLKQTQWDLFDAIQRLSDQRQAKAGEIAASVEEALRSDEHVVELGPALQAAQARAVQLLTQAAPPRPSAPQVNPAAPPAPPPAARPGKRIVDGGERANLELAAAQELLSKLDRERKMGQDVRVNVSWTIEEQEKQA